jgi:hypothetical protein
MTAPKWLSETAIKTKKCHAVVVNIGIEGNFDGTSNIKDGVQVGVDMGSNRIKIF